MNILIVGGTSGLGLELARQYRDRGHEIYVTGRTQLTEFGIHFHPLDLSGVKSTDDIDFCVAKLPQPDICIYAAGFFQEGHIGDLSDSNIDAMIDVGIRAPALILSRILERDKKLLQFIGITSTSAWTPREREPLYTAVKAGLEMFGKSLSLDPAIGKVLIAGPSGMQTSFWNGATMDTSAMLNPTWVAEQIVKNAEDDYIFRSIRILREPPRVEVFDERI